MTRATAAKVDANSGGQDQSATPTAIILLYHRVVELPADPQLLAVTPAHFAEHLEVLRNWGRTIRLAELPAASGPTPAVVLSFDDGYADNLEHAAPLLQRYGVPATFFIVSGALGGAREFWWDELEQLLLCSPPQKCCSVRPPCRTSRETGVLRPTRGSAATKQRLRRTASPGEVPAKLVLTIAGRAHEWDLESTPRHQLYCDLHRLLRPLSAPERAAVLDELWRLRGAPAAARPTHRPLTPAEVVTLAQHDLLDIGAHTATHSVLANLPPSALAAEIDAPRRQIERLLDRPVNSFSYPFGGRADYTPAVVAAVRAAGFRQACANFAGAVTPASDPLQLPRFLVRDWDGATFRRRLEEWTAG